MNKLKSITFEGEKPGINGGEIRFFFDGISNKGAIRMTPDFRSGQDLEINVVDNNVVTGRIITNDPQEYLNLKHTQPNTEYFFI